MCFHILGLLFTILHRQALVIRPLTLGMATEYGCRSELPGSGCTLVPVRVRHHPYDVSGHLVLQSAVNRIQ